MTKEEDLQFRLELAERQSAYYRDRLCNPMTVLEAVSKYGNRAEYLLTEKVVMPLRHVLKEGKPSDDIPHDEPVIIEPFGTLYDDATETRVSVQTRIWWDRIPNQAMKPHNHAARQIFAAMAREDRIHVPLQFSKRHPKRFVDPKVGAAKLYKRGAELNG